MSTTVTLDARLDYQSVEPLRDTLLAAGPAELVIDAAHVRHIGTLALQTILAVVKTRATNNQATRVREASDACVDQLGLFGFTPETLTQPEEWA
ncbi:hypothetical protein AQS8620_02970 [Aquimixticola soesokkakensis]|uniref:STAS domain-containing protein n=1 Tax=Aquimixticola soesokkakensis TaxID=1519096 RepID=A0A1Y5TIC5_9RHOB|nr:STAS domain-containing protein [Aquimixticola soesokkakensis]SLN64768.1 hypothetical protein AQS8620_02970 [Aquimixticola soesokkakensis]